VVVVVVEDTNEQVKQDLQPVLQVEVVVEMVLVQDPLLVPEEVLEELVVLVQVTVVQAGAVVLVVLV
jgi:hypothetical protein